MSLSHRVSDGGEITEEETAALQKLSAYAGSMTVRLAEMEAGLNTGALSFGEVSRRLQEDDPGGAAVPDLQQSFLEMEEELADYPTMIYDGPFSDHIYQQQPRALEGQSTFPESFARNALTQLSGVSEIRLAGETGGSMPCYQFAGETALRPPSPSRGARWSISSIPARSGKRSFPWSKLSKEGTPSCGNRGSGSSPTAITA